MQNEKLLEAATQEADTQLTVTKAARAAQRAQDAALQSDAAAEGGTDSRTPGLEPQEGGDESAKAGARGAGAAGRPAQAHSREHGAGGGAVAPQPVVRQAFSHRGQQQHQPRPGHAVNDAQAGTGVQGGGTGQPAEQPHAPRGAQRPAHRVRQQEDGAEPAKEPGPPRRGRGLLALNSLLDPDSDAPSQQQEGASTRANVSRSNQQRLFGGWEGRVLVGVLPLTLFPSGHVFFVQRLHEVRTWGVHASGASAGWQWQGSAALPCSAALHGMHAGSGSHAPWPSSQPTALHACALQRGQLQPMVVRTTHQAGGSHAKVHRLREAHLFADEPAYYGLDATGEQLADGPRYISFEIPLAPNLGPQVRCFCTVAAALPKLLWQASSTGQLHECQLPDPQHHWPWAGCDLQPHALMLAPPCARLRT